MDLNGRTVTELQQLIADASNALYAAQTREQDEAAARRASIAALLGEEGAEPGVGSIRAVRAYDAADITAGRERGHTLGEHSGLALSLAFEALEILAALSQTPNET